MNAEQTQTLRLGIIGGTFDPIHIGHLVIAEEARVCFRLYSVIFVPARLQPLKRTGACAPAEDRFRMVQLAIADNPCFAVSRLELDREGPSFTVDTLKALKAQYGSQAQLYFIMGADALSTFKAWHRPHEVLQLARIIAFSRPGYMVDWDALEQDVPGIAQATDVMSTINLHISSTDLRTRVRAGLPIRYQVPAAVLEYIQARGLYRADAVPCCDHPDQGVACPPRAIVPCT